MLTLKANGDFGDFNVQCIVWTLEEYCLKWPMCLNLKEMYRDRREKMSLPDVWENYLVTSFKDHWSYFFSISWLSSINPKGICLWFGYFPIS